MRKLLNYLSLPRKMWSTPCIRKGRGVASRRVASLDNYRDSRETPQLFGHSSATCAKSTSVYFCAISLCEPSDEFSFGIARAAEGRTKTAAESRTRSTERKREKEKNNGRAECERERQRKREREGREKTEATSDEKRAAKTYERANPCECGGKTLISRKNRAASPAWPPSGP